MNLVAYRPTASLLDFDGMWNHLVRNVFDGEVDTWNRPAADVHETEDHYVVEMDLPGRTEKDLDVEVKDNILTVASRKEDRKEEKKNGYILRERRESSFTRSFRLPVGVDAGKIEAAFRNGVLELRVPKAPEAKPRRIAITAN